MTSREPAVVGGEEERVERSLPGAPSDSALLLLTLAPVAALGMGEGVSVIARGDERGTPSPHPNTKGHNHAG